MIVITGGAGFIGSNLVASLLNDGYHDIVICDHFGSDDKWRNLSKHEFSKVVPPEELLTYLEQYKDEVEIVYHLGAISSTTETDVDRILGINFTFSVELWKWCTANGARFIYASSAATYGDGLQGFDDSDDVDYIASLRPMNPYGWSKNLFDLRAARKKQQQAAVPPQWAGLKFFNAYGPNEYHKGEQMSVLRQIFPHAEKNRPVRLFKSQNGEYKDGEQKRDFIYVKDCCDVMVWLYKNPNVSGIFNVGTGGARTFNDLAAALFESLGHSEPRIDYIDMPVEIVDKYQYVTEANMDKLRAAGYDKPSTSLEDGVEDYIKHYLNTDDPYR